jgi:hypothetical protein
MAPFDRPQWDVIVLHPHAMLPDGLALGIAQNRTFYVSGQPPPESKVTWTWWITSGDRLCSSSLPNEYLPSFIATDVRVDLSWPAFSSLAMVINAHSKLDQFMREHGASATPRVQKFAQLMSDLVTEIFFVPDGHYNVMMEAKTSVRIPQHDQSASPSQVVQGAGYESVVNPVYGTTERASVSSDEDEFPGMVEAPEVPDADGLTDSEFRLVSTRARDSRLDGKERADAAMMMLFGTRREYSHDFLAFQMSNSLHL